MRSLDEVASKVDGAIIATPNHTHLPIALDCFARGISVLIEKPLATTVQDGEAICRAADEAGLVAAVGYVHRFRPDVALLKDLLDRQYFGHVKRFAYQYGTRGGWSPVSNYILNRADAGGGVLVVTGSHFLDQMLYLFGEPKDASLQHDGENGPDANAFAQFAFDFQDAELQGEARFSKTTAMPAGLALDTESGLVVHSDRGTIHHQPKNFPDLDAVINYGNDSLDSRTDLFQLQLQDFVSACRNEVPPRVSAVDGLKSVRLIERLYASAELIEGHAICAKSPERLVAV